MVGESIGNLASWMVDEKKRLVGGSIGDPCKLEGDTAFPEASWMVFQVIIQLGIYY